MRSWFPVPSSVLVCLACWRLAGVSLPWRAAVASKLPELTNSHSQKPKSVPAFLPARFWFAILGKL